MGKGEGERVKLGEMGSIQLPTALPPRLKQ